MAAARQKYSRVKPSTARYFLLPSFSNKTVSSRTFLNEKQKGTVPSFPPPLPPLFILFLPYICNVELFLKLFWLGSWMQSNKNSLLRCTLLQVVNMSLSTKLTFQSTQHILYNLRTLPQTLGQSHDIWFPGIDISTWTRGKVPTVTTGCILILH